MSSMPYKKQTARAKSPASTPGLIGGRSLVARVLSKPEDYPSEFLAWLPRFLAQNANFQITALQLPLVEKSKNVGDVGNAQFEHSWVNYDATHEPATYYKDPFGRVFLGGLLKSGSLGSSAWTLPAGYRPATQVVYAANANGAFGWGSVYPDGRVVPEAGSNVYFSLSGVSFRQFS